MNDFDHLDLDGHLLRLFLAVLEQGSVTAAADRLGLTQSAVSHALAKLRAIVRDPLFVKSGRGIVATAHAEALADSARRLIDSMSDFSRGAQFAPARARLSLTIAANDLQRDVLLPGFLKFLEEQVASVEMRIIPSDAPTADILREGGCDLLVTPYPPDGVDILQRRLFRDEYVCFYDRNVRSAPTSLADYLAARHVTVVYPNRARLTFDTQMERDGLRRHFAASVASFSGVASFLRATDRLATLPSLLGAGLMREFAAAPVPQSARAGDLSMSLVWHRRHAADPAMTFVRQALVRHAAASVRRARAGIL
ncbi:MAG: LysR family transcriptional regulator [Hyphomicrobiales bacterium]|nr:LysR family transcriptional regulator [Hyphomicrobiales bacterium]